MAPALCCLAATASLAAGIGAQAGDSSPAPDKSAFNLFNPTPSKYLREMDTDGPGATESPYTVDAGHFQFETTLLGYTYDRNSSGGATHRADAWAIAPTILKVGLLNHLDAQLVLEPYQLVYERDNGNRTTRRGFGDTSARLKYNLWGDDGGNTALAATPYVKFPTSENGLGDHGIGGGLILPMGLTLPGDFYLGLTTRFDAVRDESDRRYHAEFGNSIELVHDLFKNLFGYVEFFSDVSTEHDTDWVGTFDTGLVWALTENIQLNAGVNLGVTAAADDLNVFIGLAWRF